VIDGGRAFGRIVAQHELGPRFAGSLGHARAHELLSGWLASADERKDHLFDAEFFGKSVACKNLWGRFRGNEPGRILLGTHFDTRPWADRDGDPARQKLPVPGANDGGSGVALLAELATLLESRRDRPTVDIVFFDAEDWHDIDGHEVSLGARRFVGDLDPRDRPDAVVIVDMVGGKNLTLDIDVTCQDHDPSYALTLSLFQLGRVLELPAFSLKKPQPYKWIACDHSPFSAAGIPSAILIDIDYPEWHTTEDLPDRCDPDSLAQVGRLLEAFLFGHAG
jgi:glutaminyl-peptide cyclotransferase